MADQTLDPNWLAAQLAGAIARAQGEAQEAGRSATPMQLVNALLQLQGPQGQKLVFTRFDLYQCFALWTAKLEGRAPVQGQAPEFPE